LLIGGAAAYFLTQFKNFGKTLSIRIGSIRFNKQETARAAWMKIFADVNLVLNNQSTVQGSVKGGKIDVISNNKLLGTVDRISEVKIMAAGSTTIPLLIGINTLSIFPAISDLINLIGKGQSIKLQFKGVLITNFGNVDIDETVNFAL
jgi:hypothetical protein